MRMRIGACLLLLAAATACHGQPHPRQVAETTYPCSLDNSQQPTLVYNPKSRRKVPLVVTLHSWSADYKQTLHADIARWCVRKGWFFIHPNFRGPNQTPMACGSEAAVSDIRDAVAWAKKVGKIDSQRVYLIGTSGGGHMTLLMAGRAPELFTAASAWVPITDLAAWHGESIALKNKYHKDIELSCGGPPNLNEKVAFEYRRRSPLTWLKPGLGVAIDINAGINDGHTGSVPISHSLLAFNALVPEKDRIEQDHIDELVRTAKVPAALRDRTLRDKTYGKKPPLFRREADNVRVTIFDGGHELISNAAIQWLESRR